MPRLEHSNFTDRMRINLLDNVIMIWVTTSNKDGGEYAICGPGVLS